MNRFLSLPSITAKCKWMKELNWSFDVFFHEQSFTALITLSFISHNSSTMPMFHLPLCLLSPCINATSSIAIFVCLWLFYILCLSIRERWYSLFHLFQAASLQRLIYRCRFLITLSSSSNCFSGIVIGFPCIRMFGVNTGN